MESITDLFGKYKIVSPSKRTSERGELITYFTEQINSERLQSGRKEFQLKYIAYRLSHLKELKDLFYLKSVCDSESKRGQPFGKIFWGSLKIK